MIDLEHIRRGARIRGLLDRATVNVTSARRLGTSAVAITFRTDGGRTGSMVVARAHQRQMTWDEPPEFAHRDSHGIREDPGPMEPIPYEEGFSEDEVRRLRLGVVPYDMGEKWFIYQEGPTLYLHRSWTGYCIFTVRLRRAGDGWEVGEARVCADPSRYERWSDAYECALLRFLIRDLMLDQRVPFPLRDDTPEDVPLLLVQHQVVGKGVTDRAFRMAEEEGARLDREEQDRR